jgi:hypothetical protein
VQLRICTVLSREGAEVPKEFDNYNIPACATPAANPWHHQN